MNNVVQLIEPIDLSTYSTDELLRSLQDAMRDREKINQEISLISAEIDKRKRRAKHA
jgi:hypothetical protein